MALVNRTRLTSDGQFGRTLDSIWLAMSPRPNACQGLSVDRAVEGSEWASGLRSRRQDYKMEQQRIDTMIASTSDPGRLQVQSQRSCHS